MKQSLNIFTIILFFIILFACDLEPKNIEFGFDNCYKCGMTIADEKWGAEIVTHKGKVYKFDAVYCMVAYYLDEKKSGRDSEIHSFWTINYLNSKELIEATSAYYLKSTEHHTPIAFNTPAFKPKKDRDKSFKTDKDIPLD